MSKHMRIRGVRRKRIDEDKLALAFLLLAKDLHAQECQAADADDAPKPLARSDPPAEPEAA
jgi:hypothetical protein